MSHRKPWWSVGQIRRAPIVVNYMGRRPPVFAVNIDGVALLNVGHGIFPRQTLSTDRLFKLVEYLNIAIEKQMGMGERISVDL